MGEEESLSKVIGISISLFLISIPLPLTSYGLLLNLFKPWFLAAGQERFRTLTSSYYRGAQGIILVYDVTRRETFDNLSDVWAKEVELYSTNKDCVKMLIGNKVDRESERAVSREEGISLAKELGSFFLECSAKTRENVEKCFEELALKIMEAPSLIEEGSTVVKRNILKQQEFQPASTASCCL